MHIRVLTFRGEPDRLDDGIAFVRDQAQPAVQQLPGSLGLAMWAERESGRSVVATAWTDLAALDASEAVLSTGIRAQAARYLGGDPTTEVYERVLVHIDEPGRPGQWTRSSRVDVAPSDVDAVLAYVEDTALPALREDDGLAAAALLLDRRRGRALAVMTYRDRDAVLAGRDRAQQLRGGLAAAVPGSALHDVSERELVIAGLAVPAAI